MSSPFNSLENLGSNRLKLSTRYHYLLKSTGAPHCRPLRAVSLLGSPRHYISRMSFFYTKSLLSFVFIFTSYRPPLLVNRPFSEWAFSELAHTFYSRATRGKHTEFLHYAEQLTSFNSITPFWIRLWDWLNK